MRRTPVAIAATALLATCTAVPSQAVEVTEVRAVATKLTPR